MLWPCQAWLRGVALSKHKAFVKQSCKLSPKVLKLKGKASWDDSIPCINCIMGNDSPWALKFAESCWEVSKTVNFLHCPKCGKVASSHGGSFQRRDLDLKVKCAFCSCRKPCRTWQCPCKMPWHACSIHGNSFIMSYQNHTDICNKPINRNVSRKRKATVKQCAHSTDEDAFMWRHAKRVKLLKQQGLKRAGIFLQTQTSKTLRRPTVLGPILEDRFRHLPA